MDEEGDRAVKLMEVYDGVKRKEGVRRNEEVKKKRGKGKKVGQGGCGDVGRVIQLQE